MGASSSRPGKHSSVGSTHREFDEQHGAAYLERVQRRLQPPTAPFARLTDMLPSEQSWHPVDYEIETAWLRDRTPASGPNSAGSTNGYEPDGYPHAIWVLHAMYEPIDPKPSAAGAYDQNDLAATLRHVQQRQEHLHGVDFSPLGVANPDPGPGWQRLRWRELAARLGSSLQGHHVPPCFRWFPDEGWPDNLIPPTEGSLDQPTAGRLIAHLANAGRSTECNAAYSFLAGRWPEDTNPCFAGSVDRLPDLCEIEFGTPSNFWPMDRSWFVYTDWDLWATKVNGPPTLIAALEADAELDTINWPDPDPRS